MIHGGVASYYNIQNQDKISFFSSLSLAFSTGPLNIVYTPYRFQNSRLQTDYKRVQVAVDFTTSKIMLGV